MRSVRILLPLLCSVLGCGCFQLSVVVRVNPDGSGTLDTRALLLANANERFQHLEAQSGFNDLNAVLDDVPIDVQAVARHIGARVVRSTSISGPEGRGVEATFSFADINQLRPTFLAGLVTSHAGYSIDQEPLSFEFQRNGQSARLKAQLGLLEGTPGNPVPFVPPSGNKALEQSAETAIIRDLLRGSRLTIIVEPNGTIVRANTPHVQDGHVTLLDIEPERLTSEEVEMKMQGARTNEEMRAVLNEAAGVVMALAPEVIIEFTPTR